jgi:hypothetical protein
MATMGITTKIGCNNMCDYCPQKKVINAYIKRSKEVFMSLDVFKKCLSKIPLNVTINFSGFSEPWLNKDCTKMLLWAYKKGYPVTAYTTLVGMNKEDIDLIKDIKFENFVVHLPDADKKTEIKVDKDYLKVLDYLCKNRPLNCKFHYFWNMDPSVSKVFERNKIIPRDISEKLLGFAGNSFPTKNNNLNKRLFCMSGMNLNNQFLLPNGDVSLCCMDYGLEHILGNLLKQDYSSLFKGKEFQRVKNSLKQGKPDILCIRCEKAGKLYSKDSLVYLIVNSPFFGLFTKSKLIKSLGKKILGVR